MSDTLNTTAELDNLIQTLFVRKALPRLVAKAVLYQFAEKTPLPQGGGKTVRWNAWSNFTPVTGALSEAVNPQLGAISSRKVEATIEQYGKGVKTSDLVEYTSSLDLVQGVVENLGDYAGLSVDKVIQKAIFKNNIEKNQDAYVMSAWFSAVVSAFRLGTNTTNSDCSWGFPVVLGGSTATRLSNVKYTGASQSAKMSLWAIRKAVKQLRQKNAMEFADGYYKLVANTDAISELSNDPAFKQWLQYTTSAPLEAGEAIRPIEGCKIYKSNNLPKHRGAGTRPHSCDLTFIFGQGAYGVTEFGNGGKGFEIIIKRSGSQDTSNPLNMYATLSYKFNLAAAALNVSAGRVLITVQ